MKATPTPGRLTVEATATVQVSYDTGSNIVQVIERGQVIRTEVAPRNYTAAAFVRTVQKVRTYFSKN